MQKHRVNAFTKDQQGGNAAGVVLDADDFTDQQMLEIAQELGLSETAFISQSDKADFQIRFFTPIAEVDLCGHATIASFGFMYERGLIKPGAYTQETKAGVLAIQVLDDALILMDQNPPEFSETLDSSDICQALNLSHEQFIDHTAQVVSTGLRDIIVGIKSLDDLLVMQPDFDQISKLSKQFDCIGIHAFSLETKHEQSTAHCRNFAPLYDIDEEAATGTTNGALASYLWQHGLADSPTMIMEQGYCMDSASEIFVRLETKAETITKVQVGGYASLLCP